MLNKLVKLANLLDSLGYTKQASEIDELMQKITDDGDLSELLKKINEKNCKKCNGGGWKSDESYSNAERTNPNFDPWKGDCEFCGGDGLAKELNDTK